MYQPYRFTYPMGLSYVFQYIAGLYLHLYIMIDHPLQCTATRAIFSYNLYEGEDI